MHKEEIQALLDRFGFQCSVNKIMGDTGLVHMMHVGNAFTDLVEYTIEAATNLTKGVWMFREGSVDLAETIAELEIWLDK